MIQRISILSLIILIFSGFSSDAHESYMSVTQMKYNPETNSIQCEMKLTAHDLEKALKIISGKPVILDKSSMKVSNNKLMEQYVQSNFRVKINEIKTYITYVGYEVELNDNAWIYFEIPCPEVIDKIELSNLVLTATFALQQNVTHLTTNTNTHSFVFTKNETINTFNWNE